MYLKQNFYTNLEVETFGISGLYLNKLEITCNYHGQGKFK